MPGADQYSATCKAVWGLIYVFAGDSFHSGDATGCYFVHDSSPTNLLRFTAAFTVTAAHPNNNGNCCESVGNPISPGPGNKLEIDRDYAGAGQFPLGFERTYNSNTLVPDGRLGSRWRGSYDRSLRVSMTGGAINADVPAAVHRGDGKIHFFNSM